MKNVHRGFGSWCGVSLLEIRDGILGSNRSNNLSDCVVLTPIVDGERSLQAYVGTTAWRKGGNASSF